MISWLPAAHIAERGAHYYLPVIMGVSVTICPDPRKIIEILPQVRPTWFFAVPRIWEKLKAGLEDDAGQPPEGEQREPGRSRASRRRSRRCAPSRRGEEVPEEVAGRRQGGRGGHVRGPARRASGSTQVVAVNVGAAPTPLEVLEFFHAIGIPVGELWGMSETCGVATLNPPEKVKLGTVGPPTPGIEIKLAEDGEVLVTRRLDHGRLPQHARQDRRDDRRRRLARRPATSASSTRTAT